MKVMNRLPKGEELYRVQHVFIPFDTNAGITDDELASVLHECINLETVQLSGIPDTSNRTIRIMAAAAINLRGIDLSGCLHITETGILELAAQCTTLEWIRLNGVLGLTDAAISALAQSCPRLAELELNSCNLLTALCIRDIWMFTRRLRRLKLAKCTQLTDKAFPSRASPNSSYSITHLSLEKNILPPLMLPPSYSHVNLRVLDLGFCSRITDEAVAGIVMCAPKIQTLILSGCTKLTNDAVDSVCNLGIHLDVLALAYVSNITDPAVVRLVWSCPRLRSVDLACQ
jgi:F-box and leucine-rich repeat protein GRR1